MLLTLLLQLFCDIYHKRQTAQFCWNGDVMVTHSVSLTEDCVAVAGGEELFIFEFFCSFTVWSCITLCVDIKWLNKLVVFPWGADMVTGHILHNIFIWSESDFSKPTCFHTTEFALPFFTTNGCISANFYHHILHIFSKHSLAICTGVAEREHFLKWSTQMETEEFTAFTTQATACGRMIVLLWLSCFHDREKLKSKFKFNSSPSPTPISPVQASTLTIEGGVLEDEDPV